MGHIKENCKLTKCEVTIDPEGKKYPRMHLQYLVETEYETKLIDVPEAILPLKADTFIVGEYSNWELWENKLSTASKDCWLPLNDNKCPLEYSIGEFAKTSYLYAEKILERRAKKMTVKEIEDKFGYPIEIVSEKE